MNKLTKNRWQKNKKKDGEGYSQWKKKKRNKILG